MSSQEVHINIRQTGVTITPFLSNVKLLYPSIPPKTIENHLMFSGGIEMSQWEKMR